MGQQGCSADCERGGCGSPSDNVCPSLKCQFAVWKVLEETPRRKLNCKLSTPIVEPISSDWFPAVLALSECPVKFNSNFDWWFIDRCIFFGVRSLKLPINFFAMALCGVVVWNSAVRSVAGLLCYVDAFGEFGKRLGWIAQKNTVADLTHCIVIGLRRLHTARSNHRLRLLKGQSHLSFRYSRPKSESE